MAGKTWTPERKAAMSEKMKGRTLTNNERFLIKQEANRFTTTSEVVPNTDNAASAVSVERTGASLIGLYKPGDYGSQFLFVTWPNVANAMAAGYTESCPDCGAYCQQNDDECPSQLSVPRRICPIPSCSREIKDMPPIPKDERAQSTAIIDDGAFVASTPELRTKSRLEAHMAAYHPSEYAAYAPKDRVVPSQVPVPGRIGETA